MNILPTCILYTTRVCLVSEEARRGHQTPLEVELWRISSHSGVLGTESSECWELSPPKEEQVLLKAELFLRPLGLHVPSHPETHTQ